MRPIDIAAILYFPLIVAAAAAIVRLYRRHSLNGLGQFTSVALGLLLTFGSVTLLGALGSETRLWLAASRLFYLMAGSLFLAGLWLNRNRNWSSQFERWFVTTAMLIFALMIGGGLGAWPLLGDLLTSRRQVVGQITKLESGWGLKGNFHYEVYVDGRRFLTTADVYRTVSAGERIVGEIGAGSNYILSIQRR